MSIATRCGKVTKSHVDGTLFISFDENSRLFLNEFECIRYFPSLAQLKKI
jgi:hypothetical protein